MKKIYEENILKEIEKGILNAQYDQVAKKFKNMSDEDIYDIIYFNIADRTESLSVYGFTQYMFRKTGNTVWLSLSVSIMAYVLCRMEGAYAVGIFHAREAVKIEKNFENFMNSAKGTFIKSDGSVISFEEMSKKLSMSVSKASIIFSRVLILMFGSRFSNL